jgi:hypothetical protein
MKKPPIIRDICGTTAGYRKHKNSGEDKCSPCVEAYNVWRRGAYNPEKNREHKQAYLAKPEKQQMRDEYFKSYVKPTTQAELDARRMTQFRRIHRKLLALQAKKIKEEAKQAQLALKAEKEAAHKAQMALNAENRRTAVEAYRAEKKLRDDAEKEARRIERERLRTENPPKVYAPLGPEERAARKEARRLKALEEKMARVVNHGTTYAMYDLCKFQNGTACKPCKAAAAEYVRGRPNKIVYNKVSGKRRKELVKVNGRKYYTRISILERDEYMCHLCGEKTDPTATHIMGQPGWERYPHLDHVIPISKGGSDTPDNVKVAHAECNLIKGDTPVIAL